MRNVSHGGAIGRAKIVLKVVDTADPAEVKALLLGPLIVEPVFRSRGIGEALVTRSLEAARAAGAKLVILVGDEPYYSRMGFRRLPPGRVTLPGPVDPGRMLACELEPGAADSASGLVRGRQD